MGWARANLLFDRMTVLPDPGSPMEILILVLWRMRQNIEFQKSRAVMTALLNQQGAEAKFIEKAYADLKEAFFPFEKSDREEEISVLKKVMEKELARGPLSVKPMVDVTRNNMKAKLAQGDKVMQDRARQLRKGTLKTLEADPFQTARSRSRNTASMTNIGSVMKPVRPTTQKQKSPV